MIEPAAKAEKSIFGTASAMMVIMLAGKTLGILRDRMQAVYYGTDTAEGIAFMQASALPRHFLDIMFASVLSASFIPVFNTYLEQAGKRAAFDLAARFISVTLVLTGVFTLLCIAGASPLYAIFLDGAALDAETRALGIRLLRMMFPLIVLSGLAFALTGVVQSLGQFNIPAAMSVVSNGIILVYFWLFIDTFGVYGLCVAFLLGWAAQAVIMLPFLAKARFRFRFRLDWRDPGLRQIAALTVPVIVASWLGPVNLLVNGKAAVNLYGGKYGYNAINLAYNLYAIITGVFVLSVANVLFPKLSRLAASDDADAFAAQLRTTLRGLFFWLLPMTFGLMIVSKPLVKLVYQGGLFNDLSTETTAAALFYFAAGIVGYGLQIVLSRACYALKKGRAPLVTAVVAMAINAVLSFSLTPVMAVGGPALASAIAITVAGGGLLVVLCKSYKAIWPRQMTWAVARMLCAAVVMGLVAVACREWLYRFADGRPDTMWMRLWMLIVPAAVSAPVYFAGCWLLRVDEVRIWTAKALRFVAVRLDGKRRQKGA